LRLGPVFLFKKERWTLKISAEERVYLMNHWMDLDGCIGEYYLVHEGFLLVLFDLSYSKCMQSYRSNTTEQLTKVV
jgi:hypothetical protein